MISVSPTRLSKRRLPWVLLLTMAAVLLYVGLAPWHWSADTPLLWDMSHHELGAVDFADALRSGSPVRIAAELFTADLYPPFHSVVTGSWFAVFGSSPLSWLILGLFIHLATVILLARRNPLSAALFLGAPLLMGLAPTLMVEPLAILLLVASLLAIERAVREESLRWYLLSALLALSTLLTKYNVGLPLLVALPVAALSRPGRRNLFFSLGGAVAVAALFLLFLALQRQGFSMFAAFARNRSNAAGLSPWQHLAWYAQLFAHRFSAGPLVAAPVVLLAALASFRRSAITWAAGAYVLSSIAALALHPYLLDRNLSAPAVALFLAAGIGAEVLERVVGFRRLLPVMTLAVVIAAGLRWDDGRRLVEKEYPPIQASLAGLSHLVEDQLRETPPTLILGTFDGFSAGWVRLLRRRAHTSSSVMIETPPPAFSPDHSPPATQLQEREDELRQWWAGGGSSQIVVISLLDDSPLLRSGERGWNEWMRRMAATVDADSTLRKVRSDTLRVGAVLSVYHLMDGPFWFGAGWNPREDWGRWAQGHQASLEIDSDTAARALRFEVTVAESSPSPQTWSATVDGVDFGPFTTGDPPWTWQEMELPLKEGTHHLVRFHFERTGGPAGQPLALAFRRFRLDRADGSQDERSPRPKAGG